VLTVFQSVVFNSLVIPNI